MVGERATEPRLLSARDRLHILQCCIVAEEVLSLCQEKDLQQVRLSDSHPFLLHRIDLAIATALNVMVQNYCSSS